VGVCIDSQGITYVLVAGKFIKMQDNKGGGLDLIGLLLLFTLFIFFSYRPDLKSRL
jgi:hypothetical protein